MKSIFKLHVLLVTINQLLINQSINQSINQLIVCMRPKVQGEPVLLRLNFNQFLILSTELETCPLHYHLK